MRVNKKHAQIYTGLDCGLLLVILASLVLVRHCVGCGVVCLEVVVVGRLFSFFFFFFCGRRSNRI